jgi:hypothetical protein
MACRIITGAHVIATILSQLLPIRQRYSLTAAFICGLNGTSSPRPMMLHHECPQRALKQS